VETEAFSDRSSQRHLRPVRHAHRAATAAALAPAKSYENQ